MGRQFCNWITSWEAQPLHHLPHSWPKRRPLGPPTISMSHIQPCQAALIQRHRAEERPGRHALCEQLQILSLQHAWVPLGKNWGWLFVCFTPSYTLLVSLCQKVNNRKMIKTINISWYFLGKIAFWPWCDAVQGSFEVAQKVKVSKGDFSRQKAVFLQMNRETY